MLKQHRLVLIISILASFVAFLDGSIVNVALPTISRDLGGGLATQQWVVDAYLTTLGALILLAGSLSDLFGRKRILYIGLIGFGITSLLCAFAPSSSVLIVARALQGVAGALLVPSSLAIIISTFPHGEQGKAIGRWTAWTGIAFVIGPLLGGFLVDAVSWRLIFAVNVVPIAINLWLLKFLDLSEVTKKVKVDVAGAVLCSLGLALVVFGLIEQPRYGWGSVGILASLVLGVLLLVAFLYMENKKASAMLDLKLFKIRNFTFGNLATVGIYGGLSVATFIIVIYLQQVGGYSALKAGLALLPTTIIMFSLSPRFGALSSKFGSRIFMTIGPLLAGAGYLLMLRVGTHVSYASQLLPGVLVFALGLSITVAPLTSAVLGDVGKGRAGIASAVNNAVARIAGLITVAFIGVIIGSKLNLHSFHEALIFTACLVMSGGIISFVGIRKSKGKNTETANVS